MKVKDKEVEIVKVIKNKDVEIVKVIKDKDVEIVKVTKDKEVEIVKVTKAPVLRVIDDQTLRAKFGLFKKEKIILNRLPLLRPESRTDSVCQNKDRLVSRAAFPSPSYTFQEATVGAYSLVFLVMQSCSFGQGPLDNDREFRESQCHP